MPVLDAKLLLGHRLMVYDQGFWQPVTVVQTKPAAEEGITDRPAPGEITHIRCRTMWGTHLELAVELLNDIEKVKSHDLWEDTDIFPDFDAECFQQRAEDHLRIRKMPFEGFDNNPCGGNTKRSKPTFARGRDSEES